MIQKSDHQAGKKSSQWLEPLDEYFDSLADEVRRLAADGKRKLLVTSSGAGEGKSTITAGLGRALARSGRTSVVLVDTDQMRPTLHTLFGLDNRRGLGELIEEIHHFDPIKEDPQQFGLGDWLELLCVQGRSGRLSVAQDEQAYAIMLHKGAVACIAEEPAPEERRIGRWLADRGHLSPERLESALRTHREVHRPFGDVVVTLGLVETEDLRAALRAQFDERLRRILMLRRPSCTFVEAAQGYLAASAGRQTLYLDGTGIDDYIRGKFGTFLRQPYLSSQMSGYLRDTSQENLKLMTSGAHSTRLKDSGSATAFASLLHHLSAAFDVVLIDSPPVAVASPTESLARIVDGVIMVVKAEGLDVQIIQRAKEQLIKNGARILGAVLNHVSVDRKDPLYYYYGAYGRS